MDQLKSEHANVSAAKRTDVSRETSEGRSSLATGSAGTGASSKRVAVVGAGIAGLAAGVYARQSGFDVTVFESHAIPGGASTSWSRKGYLFEGGMHWLTGSSPKTALNAVWNEIGALDAEVPIYVRDPFLAYEFEGRTVYLYRDVDRLEEHLLDVAPEDARQIRRLVKDVRAFMKVSMPVFDLKGVKAAVPRKAGMGEMLAMLPAMARMPAYANQTARAFADRFSNPLLRTLFASMVGEDMSAMGLAFTLATLAAGDGGYPLGGSLAMARRVAETLERLGGRIEYRSLVEQVAVRDGRAVGVVVDGEERAFDAVIVTQDLRWPSTSSSTRRSSSLGRSICGSTCIRSSTRSSASASEATSRTCRNASGSPSTSPFSAEGSDTTRFPSTTTPPTRATRPRAARP